MTPLPSPFEGKYGYIRYRAKATVSLIRTFSNKDYKCEKLFSMTGPTLDLNQHPTTQSEVQHRKEMIGCCGCGCSPESIITAGLPKKGFVPGEGIYVIGHVDNQDGDETRMFKAGLFQIVGSSGFFAKFNVVIGTVPHRTVTRPPAAVASALPTDDTGIELSGPTNGPPAPPYEPPPPSYEEAVGVIDRLTRQGNSDDCFSQDQFVPRYPYFNLTVDVPPAHRY
ncbi:uncharacterized protein LOC110987933 [Acanthaster planci]|uniref:Uncharacterized protein LOC110987933 n=1 Tax=Acanthaster planci TaxID=133434 RepID=A0A8B7ZME3_ACAPL|nr:uncharacterized protein LOC110987933 [Acanthaster planci]